MPLFSRFNYIIIFLLDKHIKQNHFEFSVLIQNVSQFWKEKHNCRLINVKIIVMCKPTISYSTEKILVGPNNKPFKKEQTHSIYRSGIISYFYLTLIKVFKLTSWPALIPTISHHETSSTRSGNPSQLLSTPTSLLRNLPQLPWLHLSGPQ